MSLPLHLLMHVFLSLVAGFVVWKIWNKPFVSFAAAVAGGVLIDLDHFIDYFLAFGFSFNPDYFTHGYQFLQSGKIYVLFHGWEYAIILLIGLFFVKRKPVLQSVFLALALGMLLHLCFDMFANEGLMFKSYSVLYRIHNDFENEALVTPEHHESFLIERQNTPFLNYGNRQ
ncbi:MAG: hypothetical protein HGA31_02975 [Candidatus Moranbacteria bacterium]|nr:hypothetical protein [Candidatus Moranbacteria bacterium]